MNISKEIEISPEELGIDAKTFEERFDELGLFIENHTEAIAATRNCYKEWRSWKGDCSKPVFNKEDQRLKYLYEDANRAQAKTYEALQIAIMGEEAWLVKRRAQKEADEKFEALLSLVEDALNDWTTCTKTPSVNKSRPTKPSRFRSWFGW